MLAMLPINRRPAPAGRPDLPGPARGAAPLSRRLPLRLLVAAVLLTMAALATAQVRWIQRSSDRGVGITLGDRQPGGGQVLVEVTPEGPADRAGIRAGDVLLRIGGQPVPDEAAYDAQAERFRRGEAVPFELLRAGEPLTHLVEPGLPFPWKRFLIDQLNGLCFLIAGLLALYLGTGYLNGSLLFVLCSAIAIECLLPVDVIGQPLIGVLSGVAFYGLIAAQGACELHLALLVPERLAALRQRRWAWVVPAIYAVWGGLAVLGAGAVLADESLLRWPIGEDSATVLVYSRAVPLSALLSLTVLGFRAVGYPEGEGRLQAGIVFLGTVPWTVSELANTSIELAGYTRPGWLTGASEPLIILAYPVAVLYVIARTARRRERLLLELPARVEERDTPAEVAALVADELQAVLHPEWVRVYDRRDGEPTLSHATGTAAGQPAGAVPPLRALADLVDRERQLLEGPAPGVQLPPAEREWLATSGTQLVVPLSGPGQRLSGMLLLGAKKSAEPYTHRERRLLGAFTRQAAIAWENLLLRDEVAAGRQREREVLAQLGGQGVDLVRECPRCGRCYDTHEVSCSRDGAELVLAVPVERLVAGRYRLERLLGKGGMGAAYEASDLRLRRTVAVKVLLPNRFGDPHARRRFEREAQLLARLRHRHLVAVHDCGETETGGAFLVMERLEGMSLQVALERYGPVQPDTAATWVGQLLDGLSAVHREGIVHRDLKPSNVYLAKTTDGDVEVKLLDFGIAKEERAGISVESLTLPGSFIGTLPYMSPEQVAGEEVDARSDLFTCGVIVVEMLTGRRPFDGPNANAVSWAILHREVHLPGGDPRVTALDAALAGLLAKKPWQRYAEAAEARQRVVPALRACPPVVTLAAEPEAPPTLQW
jgi:hypothetical protein